MTLVGVEPMTSRSQVRRQINITEQLVKTN